MSGRIGKVRSSKPRSEKTKQKDSLLSIILQNAVTMPSCSFCEGRGIPSCQVSSVDSARCTECVRLGRSRCDVQGLSASELRRIGVQHQQLEDKLESAEERLRSAAAEVERLRKQKRMWFEKMMRAVRRGIDSVEELERVEAEEAETERARVSASVQAVVSEESSIAQLDPDFEGFDWGSVDVGNAVVDWPGFLTEGSSVVGGSVGESGVTGRGN